MSNRVFKHSLRVVPYLALTGAGMVLLFWVLYFTGAYVPGESDDPIIDGFESAFPAADAILALSLIGAAIGILRKKSSGPFFLVAAGSMSVYLGILDISFYCQTPVYGEVDLSSMFCIFINVACIGGGIFALVLSWQLWRIK
jgi:hypothetical protein